MENKEVFNKLSDFIVREIGVEKEEVRKEAALENDLGVSGDDAIELLVAFGAYFNVEVTDFKVSDYFSPEGDIILPAIIRFFLGKKKPVLKDLTIGHLEKAILAGRLDEAVINS